MKKEKSRYLANNCLMAWFMTALDLVIDGCGSFEDVDRCWITVYNMDKLYFSLFGQKPWLNKRKRGN